MMHARIDEAIKQSWTEDIYRDYKQHYILKEDSLKNAFYHHLRTRLGDGFMNRNRIRIFTEFYLHDNQRADIAIVQVIPKFEFDNSDRDHLSKRVDKVLAIIELKHKSPSCKREVFIEDVLKVKKYIKLKEFDICNFYLGFIHESPIDKPWLTQRQSQTWAKGRLTELSIFWGDGGIDSANPQINSH